MIKDQELVTQSIRQFAFFRTHRGNSEITFSRKFTAKIYCCSPKFFAESLLQSAAGQAEQVGGRRRDLRERAPLAALEQLAGHHWSRKRSGSLNWDMDREIMSSFQTATSSFARRNMPLRVMGCHS